MGVEVAIPRNAPYVEPMTPQLEARLREVHPSGYLDQLDPAAYYGPELNERIRPIGDAVRERAAFSLNFSAMGGPGVLEFAITESAHPSLFD